MKPGFICSIILLISLLTGMAIKAQEASTPDPSSWDTIFSKHQVNGTFVLYSAARDKYYTWNKKRADTRYLPASTFKIPNTLIGFQTGAIRSADEVFEWNGTDYGYDAWNRDLSIREAFRLSAVWVYQEVARRVGREAMDSLLQICRYGNMKTGPFIDSFWLDGDVAISANEQIGFLNKLWSRQLPFDKNYQQLVTGIMLAETSGNRRLYAKTGWAARIQKQVGWYVGVVETPEEIWIFALNIDIRQTADLDARVTISRTILDKEGIFPWPG
ncbi:beta-lactamase class D [Lentimicrobium saccharophilum]|uniref:Beta-lactamase n=1 Tax=Lentimicrobium saccharophilum TaxID=1678841 RepID=A0A0S7C2V2_9BACT|nr:class D beta-lactamase [Lentimicrobium saccharophilum]GAP43087.1 beta-lactamase class D [Lentimicrobium saccharophilum]